MAPAPSPHFAIAPCSASSSGTPSEAQGLKQQEAVCAAAVQCLLITSSPPWQGRSGEGSAKRIARASPASLNPPEEKQTLLGRGSRISCCCPKGPLKSQIPPSLLCTAAFYPFPSCLFFFQGVGSFGTDSIHEQMLEIQITETRRSVEIKAEEAPRKGQEFIPHNCTVGFSGSTQPPWSQWQGSCYSHLSNPLFAQRGRVG